MGEPIMHIMDMVTKQVQIYCTVHAFGNVSFVKTKIFPIPSIFAMRKVSPCQALVRVPITSDHDLNKSVNSVTS